MNLWIWIAGGLTYLAAAWLVLEVMLMLDRLEVERRRRSFYFVAAAFWPVAVVVLLVTAIADRSKR